jgi:hypothetical protein
VQWIEQSRGAVLHPWEFLLKIAEGTQPTDCAEQVTLAANVVAFKTPRVFWLAIGIPTRSCGANQVLHCGPIEVMRKHLIP